MRGRTASSTRRRTIPRAQIPLPVCGILDYVDRPGISTPGVVAPPPLIFALGLALGLAVHARFPARLIAGPTRLIGGVLTAAGAGLITWAIGTMRAAGTDPRPDRPTSALVTAGPYRHTRNPIYLGMASIYAGVLLVVGTPWPMLFLPAILAVIRQGVIAREERYLAGRFGDSFSDYATRVRCWV
jgi:protein-S-isoprenylcysteine O-methyltransferase Ste14